MENKRRLSFCLTICMLIVCVFAVSRASSQTVVKSQAQGLVDNEIEARSVIAAALPKSGASDTERINALEETLRQQAVQLDELKKLLVEQQETIKMLAGRLTEAGTPVRNDATITGADLAIRAVKKGGDAKDDSPTENAVIKAEQQSTAADDKKIESRVSEIGSIKFSGDIRLRSESIFGLTNSLASAINPAAFGNDLSSRHRMRVRARLQMRGSIGQEFDWGLRLATGSFADNISTNQTLTDFFNRKPFGLDQAFITYKPGSVPGLQIQGGKFEPPWTVRFDLPWTYPEMVIDNDLMVEGFNESYTWTSKKSLKELKFVAWQLPFLERNSAFVRNADGTVNIEQSRRGGRDLALYGGQVRAKLELNPKVALNLSIADLYYSGTQFISPVQVFGSQLQLPITVIIPATATTPAQTVTSQVLIPRDLLVAGNANLGLTNASNNATNRDGRLSSGFNLVDMMARLELKHNKRFPVAFLLNFVTNTQTRDVITAGPGGADLVLNNDENNGFWGEVQIGKTKERKDLALSYTFMSIEKDAVLTPFNMSDITQQSDMRGHRVALAYVAASQVINGTPEPRVIFSFIGIVTQRPNGLFGPIIPTPAGSLNRATTRLQFDTVIRF